MNRPFACDEASLDIRDLAAQGAPLGLLWAFMGNSLRCATAAALLLAPAGSAVAQTLTVNKVEQTTGGQILDSTNAFVGIPMVYLVTITSSAPAGANTTVTVTDTLPAGGFVLLTATCTAQGTATCPAPTIPFTGNPASLAVTVTVPTGSANSVVLRMTGYFTTTGQFTNHAEALRMGDTMVEPTATVDVPLTINSQPLPIDLAVTKSVTPASGQTGTSMATATTFSYTLTVQNNSSSDVYLGGFNLTDVLQMTSGSQSLSYQLSHFACADPACPILPATATGTVGPFNQGVTRLPWSATTKLPANHSFLLTFDATFSTTVTCGADTAAIQNSAFFSLGNALGSIPDANSANNTGTAPISTAYSFSSACLPAPSLSVSKAQSPANPVAWGAPSTYTISFTNNNGVALSNLDVFDSLSPSFGVPASTVTVSAAPACSPACTFNSPAAFPATYSLLSSPTLFVAHFASVAAGQTVTITYTATFSPPSCATSGATTITNFATTNPVSGGTAINTVMASLPNCGLTVAKSLTTPNPVVLGQPVEFHVTYTNPFAQAVTVQTLADAISLTTATPATYGLLPIQITAASCQATGNVSPLPTFAAGTVMINHNSTPWSGLQLLHQPSPITFAAGASLDCTLRFVPQQPTGCDGAGKPQLINSAFIDTGNVNTSQTPAVSATATADLPLCRKVSLKKIAPTPQSFTPGQTFSYTIQVTNNNPNDPVAGVNVTDPLPPGFTYVSSSCAACSPAPTFTGGVLHASIPSIAQNGNALLTLVVTAPLTGGSYNNVATASFAQQGNFYTDSGSALTGLANVQVLTPRLTKSFSPSPQGFAQSVLTFTLTNVPGNPLEQSITFTDTLSPGIQITGIPTTTCQVGTVTASGGAITFQGQMQAGEATCTVSVPVAGAGCNDQTNFSNTSNIDPSGASAMLNVTTCPSPGAFVPAIPTLTPGGLLAMALLLAAAGLLIVWRQTARS